MPIAIVTIAGRTLLALLSILAGPAKIAGPQPFLDHMAAHHIPGVLLPLVIALELGAGFALLIGWQLSFAAGPCFALLPRSGFTLTSPTRRNGAVRQGSGDRGGTDGDCRRRVASLTGSPARPEIRNGNASENQDLSSLFAFFGGRGGPSTGGNDLI